MKVNLVEKRVKTSHWNVIRYQIITFCYMQGLTLSDSDLECLTLLALQEGKQDMAEFCQQAAARQIFATAQTVRNALRKAEKKGLVIKEGKSNKKVYLNPAMKLQTRGNILLDYKFLAVETQEV